MPGPQTRLDTLAKALRQLSCDEPSRFTATRAEVALMLHSTFQNTTRAPSGHASLIDLPPHLIWRILAHMDASESVGVYATCRAIRHARDHATALSTVLFPPSVLESMLYSYAEKGFPLLEHFALYEPSHLDSYGSRRWANYAAPFLLHSMPALKSLWISVQPVIDFLNIESHFQTYHFPFQTPGLGGFLDVPGACTSRAQPMPRLRSLTIDCSYLPFQSFTVAEHILEDANNYQVPLGIFAHGTSLRRIFTRGIAWPDYQLIRPFRSLQSFAYVGGALLNSEQLEHFVKALPALESLRLHIADFTDSFVTAGAYATAAETDPNSQAAADAVSPDTKRSNHFTRLKHILFGLTNSSRPSHEVEQCLMRCFVRNGAPDIALLLVSGDEHDCRTCGANDPSGLFRVAELACGSAHVSYRYVHVMDEGKGTTQSNWHRCRVLGTGFGGGAYMARSALVGISLAHLTSLSIHERFARGILINNIDEWTPDAFGLSPALNPAPEMIFPVLERLKVWMASCFETRQSMLMFSPGPAESRLLEDRISPRTASTVPMRFPLLNTFELSAGAQSETTELSGRSGGKLFASCRQIVAYFMPTRDLGSINCLCDKPGGGYVVSMYDLVEFLADCGFPKLTCVRICAVELVDYDLAGTFVAAQRALPNVEWTFDAERAACDVELADLYTPCGADVIFNQLEGY